VFRRLGSAFFSAPAADADDAALSSDLEKAASNSVKNSVKQVRSLAKQSFLQVRITCFVCLAQAVSVKWLSAGAIVDDIFHLACSIIELICPYSLLLFPCSPSPQSTYNMSSVKSISPQELISGTSLSRRRSALSMRDAANASDAAGNANTSSLALGVGASRKSQATTTTLPTVNTIPTGTNL
jgi:hypothetical protein